MDAGSSGTRVYVYRWPKRYVTTGRRPYSSPVTTEDWVKKIRPGISTLPDSSEETVAAYLDTLLKFSDAILKEKGVDFKTVKVPLYLHATAGMRLLDTETRGALIRATRNYLKNSHYKVENHFVKVLSGQEEGVFGWMSVNELKGTLFLPEQSDTYGALDMGGGSTQITFAPYDEVLDDYFPLQMNGVTRKLYSHSYLHFGVDELSRRIIRSMQKEEPGVSPVPNPCVNSGLTKNFTDGQGGLIEVVGTSNPDKCHAVTLSLLELDTPCFNDACALNGEYQPAIDTKSLKNMRFYAFSAYGHLIDNMKLSKNPRLDDVKVLSEKVCAMSWEDMVAQYGDDGFLHMSCIEATYFYNLLHHGFGFADDSTQITYTYKADEMGYELEWARGAMLYQVNHLGWVTPNLSSSDWRFFSGFMTFLVCVSVIMSAVLYCKVKDLERKNGTLDDYLMMDHENQIQAM